MTEALSDQEKQDIRKRDARLSLILMAIASLSILCKVKDSYVTTWMLDSEISLSQHWAQSLTLEANPAAAPEKVNEIKKIVEHEKKAHKQLRRTHRHLVECVIVLFLSFVLFAFNAPFQNRMIYKIISVPAAFGIFVGARGLLGI